MNRTGKRLQALFASLLFGCTVLTGCSFNPLVDNFGTAPVDAETTAAADTASSAVSGTEAPTESTTEAHVSPTEMIVSSLGAQLDVDVLLNKDSANDEDKIYKAPLSRLMQAGDTVSSFTFVFYAGDGVSDIGEFKGGYGISVLEGCPDAQDGWYKPEDFVTQAKGSYIELTWAVPGSVAPYIDPEGDVQVGYWWGNTPEVNLRNVICTYTRSQMRPVDSTQTISVRKTLNYSNEATQTVKVPLGDVLGEEGVPQALTFDVSAGSGFKKFTGAFGITAEGGEMYMTDTVAVLTGENSLSLTWLIPEEIAYDVPRDAEALLGYWWSEAGDMTVNSLTVKYSIGGTRPEPVTPQAQEQPAAEETQKMAGDMQNKDRASAIAADIRLGWNLGNTLDSYDKDNSKNVDETYWGNPRATKALFDTVKAKGFNAVRIPVSWTNHLGADNTIDADWMNRVQEVVDYAMADDLYVILNMHHDDYTWFNPLYAQEDAVTEKYLKIWTQIADRFKDYDTKLLFEGMNEPRMVGSATEWTGGTSEERDVINHMQAKFVELVRASGGKNPDRTLIVTTHAASITDAAVGGLVLPQDDNLIVSIHNYSPWKFTTKDSPAERRFDSKGKIELDRQFAMLHGKFGSKGIPVIITEFGAENKNNDSDRQAFYSYYIQAAARYGIPCFIWDNGSSDSYGILDRKNNSWCSNGIADAAIAAVN